MPTVEKEQEENKIAVKDSCVYILKIICLLIFTAQGIGIPFIPYTCDFSAVDEVGTFLVIKLS